jgi:trimeric autotransporter adhesin
MRNGSRFRLGTGLQLIQFNNPSQQKMKTKNMTTLHPKNSISRSSLRLGFLLIPLAFGCFALAPAARATCKQACLSNGNTAEGDNALLNLTTGSYNTATGAGALVNNTTGTGNTANGVNALFKNTTGDNNTAYGREALGSNTTGIDNAANGYNALFLNTTGNDNTASGTSALQENTTGHDNTANGTGALLMNTTGIQNTASGSAALGSNTTGHDNTATGRGALFKNTTGIQNTASGSAALGSNTTGHDNTATGRGALFDNTTGIQNTASGSAALGSNTTGVNNTATGYGALFKNTTGIQNTASGVDALQNNTTGSNNTAVGFNALGHIGVELQGILPPPNNNIALGWNAGVNVGNHPFFAAINSDNIDIGNVGSSSDNRIIRIGTPGTQAFTFIAGIHGATASGGVAVYVNSSGQLGTLTSSARFKQDIHSMDNASEAILALKPVTFRYKKELDAEGIPQFGLIAEQVEKVDPDLVARDADGKPYTVRYEAVNAMLLNEFLKEHRKVENQEATITQLKSTVALQQKDFQATFAQQQKQIEALTAGLQKVSNELELSKPAPRTVSNQ